MRVGDMYFDPLIRLMESWKRDCASALQRKKLHSLRVALSGTLSPVRFRGGNRRIAAISRNIGGNAAEFLCNPDCVAERVGFGHRGLLITGKLLIQQMR